MRKKIINNFKAAHAMSRNFGGQCGTECLTGSYFQDTENLMRNPLSTLKRN